MGLGNENQILSVSNVGCLSGSIKGRNALNTEGLINWGGERERKRERGIERERERD